MCRGHTSLKVSEWLICNLIDLGLSEAGLAGGAVPGPPLSRGEVPVLGWVAPHMLCPPCASATAEMSGMGRESPCPWVMDMR